MLYEIDIRGEVVCYLPHLIISFNRLNIFGLRLALVAVIYLSLSLNSFSISWKLICILFASLSLFFFTKLSLNYLVFKVILFSEN